LFDEANFRDSDRELREVFARFDTFDFEKVMHALQSAKQVCETYGVNRGIIEQIQDDQEQLKDSLIEVIANTPPHRPGLIADDRFTSTRRFLTCFSNIFSLNYDLLLYWAVNK
jgi:hypothetical protein